MKDRSAIYTIGHSNHTLDAFLVLLRLHHIETLADVRSIPHSRYVPHFNKKPLETAMCEAGFRYAFLGQSIGGRPDEREFYDDDGYVLYHRLAGSPRFQEGIDRLIDLARRSRTALLCAEENPDFCHRRQLIGRVLMDRGWRILHVRGDGRILEDRGNEAEDGQPRLPGLEPPVTWKSHRPVPIKGDR